MRHKLSLYRAGILIHSGQISPSTKVGNVSKKQISQENNSAPNYCYSGILCALFKKCEESVQTQPRVLLHLGYDLNEISLLVGYMYGWVGVGGWSCSGIKGCIMMK